MKSQTISDFHDFKALKLSAALYPLPTFDYLFGSFKWRMSWKLQNKLEHFRWVMNSKVIDFPRWRCSTFSHGLFTKKMFRSTWLRSHEPSVKLRWKAFLEKDEEGSFLSHIQSSFRLRREQLLRCSVRIVVVGFKQKLSAKA